MREIKFRAWNALDSRDECRMLYQPNFSADFRTIMPDGNEWDLPVMQYTGLKDKNGKEVYEGDIVRWYRKSWAGNKDLEWAYEKVLWETISDDQGEYAGYDYTHWWNGEVVGNIYENPDLIK